MSTIYTLALSLKDKITDTEEYVPIEENREVMPNQYHGGHYALYKNKNDSKFCILLFAEEATPEEVEAFYHYATSGDPYTDLYANDDIGLI